MAGNGAHLRIRSLGEEVLGVELEGNPAKPEPMHFRVMFPGGDVDVVRCADDTYWVHVRVDHPDHKNNPEERSARLVAARLDVHGKPAHKADVGDFADPDLYHLAVRVAPERLAALAGGRSKGASGAHA